MKELLSRDVKSSRPTWRQAKIFGLGLMQYRSRSHEGCPRGIVVTPFILRSSLMEIVACFIIFY